MATTTSGVTLGEIGERYDLAIGYDGNPSVGNAVMTGFVIPEGGTWEESNDLQDVQSLISAGSPNVVDRQFTFWPKVSQGDWTGGGHQLNFINPTAYYDSTGQLDTSQPGNLQPFGSYNSTSYTFSNFSYMPMATDASDVYIGVSSDGTHNYVYGDPINGLQPGAVDGGASTVYSMCETPAGVMALLSSGKIFRIQFNTNFQQCNDSIVGVYQSSMAYFNDRLYYIGNSSNLKFTTLDAGAVGGTVFLTAGSFEDTYIALCSSASGLFFAKYSSTNAWNSVLYTSDGTTSGTYRIGDVRGVVKYVKEVNGVVYVITAVQHLAVGAGSVVQYYVLYSISGSTITVIDDTRFYPSDLSVGSTGGASTTGISGDGRFLYVAWPGNTFVRYDTTNNHAVHRMFEFSSGVGAYASIAATRYGYVFAISSNSGFNQQVVTVNGNTATPGSGTLTTSYFDFNAPGSIKFFRSFDIQLGSAPPNSTLANWFTLQYQVDDNAYQNVTLVTTNNANLIRAYIPAGTKGTKIRFKLTLAPTSSPSFNPVVRYYSVKANLARSWKVTVACNRAQKLLDGSDDLQGKAADKLGLIQKIIANAGPCVLFIPSPQQAGPAATPWAEQVSAVLENYSWKTPRPSVQRQPDGTPDIEGQVDLTFVESL